MEIIEVLVSWYYNRCVGLCTKTSCTEFISFSSMVH